LNRTRTLKYAWAVPKGIRSNIIRCAAEGGVRREDVGGRRETGDSRRKTGYRRRKTGAGGQEKGAKDSLSTAKHEPMGTAHAYFKVRVLFKQMQRTLFLAIGDVIIYQNDQEEILYKNLALKFSLNNFFILLFSFFCTKPGKVKKNYIVTFQTARRE